MSQENGRWRDKPVRPRFTRRAALKNQIKELRAASQEEDRAQGVIGRYRRPKKQRRYDADMEIFSELSATDREGVLYRSFWGKREHSGSSYDPNVLMRVKRRPYGNTLTFLKSAEGPDGKQKAYVARQIKLRGRKLTDREFDEKGRLVSKTTVRFLRGPKLTDLEFDDKGRLVSKTTDRFPHYKEVWERDTNGNLMQTELRRGSLNVTLSGVDEHGKRKKTVQRGKRIDVFERDEATGALTQLSSTGHRVRSNIETTISGDRRTSSTTVKQLGRRTKRYWSELDESGDEISRQEFKRQGFFTRNGDSRRSFTSTKKTTLLGNDHVRVETPGFGKPRVTIREANDGERMDLDERQYQEPLLADPRFVSDVGASARSSVAHPNGSALMPLRSPVENRPEAPDNVGAGALRALAGLNSSAAPPVVSLPPANGSRSGASTISNVAVPSAPARAQLRSPIETRDVPPDNVDVNAVRALAGLNSPAVPPVVSVQPQTSGSRASALTTSNVTVPSGPARAQLRSPVENRPDARDNVGVGALRALVGLNSSAASSVVDRSRGAGRVPPSLPSAVVPRPRPAIVGGETAGLRRVAAAPPEVSDKPSAGDQSGSREWTLDDLMADIGQASQGASTTQWSPPKQSSVNEAKGIAARQFPDRNDRGGSIEI